MEAITFVDRCPDRGLVWFDVFGKTFARTLASTRMIDFLAAPGATAPTGSVFDELAARA